MQESLIDSICIRAGVRQLAAGDFYRPRQFRMNDQRRAQPRELRHRFAQVRFSNIGKFIDARVHQKALESDDARIPERGNLTRISGHHTAPERDVDMKLAARGL